MAHPRKEPLWSDQAPIRVAHSVAGWLSLVPSMASRLAYLEDLAVVRLAARYGWCDQVGALLGEALGCAPPPCTTGAPHAARCPDTAWLLWCDGQGLDPLGEQMCGGAALVDWQRYLESCGYAPATRSRRWYAVDSWYRYCHATGTMRCRPTADARQRGYRLPSPHRVHRPVLLSVHHLACLVDAADADADLLPATAATRVHLARLRDAAAVAVLVDTAARVGELMRLRMDDWSPDPPCLYLTRKGGGRQMVPLHQSTTALTRYLSARQVAGHTVAHDAPLLATHTGPLAGTRPVTTHALRDALRRIAAAHPDLRHLAERIHPHAIRAAVLTAALDNGAALQAVQDMAGHASPVTTAVYDQRRAERGREAARDAARVISRERSRTGRHGR